MSRIAHFDGPGASDRVIRCAEKAEAAGFEHVETHYHPDSKQYSVTGTMPAVTARRTLDELLGR
ncbi:hypothetical protein GCM10010193_70240 [Kitasatospora atroaurantiaca]|uniref:Uncharacterized protein n=1 Tax=Kitasatospora atroaurantiaca TaxID=285545 RepID=A0A561ENC9_9ACTN|nr:hypothetical protein [Kitasatospora atroaurantiaca]TWE17110.1 hypothetical protein FB465_2115 [Kitasatospora atroaurantiaca]